MTSKVVVAGVGMIPFSKPGKSDPYDVMGAEAARRALADAGVAYPAVQQSYVGFVYGDSTSGQKALYRLGQSGAPVINVNNNCSTGSSALWLAHQAVASGQAEVALALGFEQMNPGALGSVWSDRPDVLGAFAQVRDEVAGVPDPGAPPAATYFGAAGQAYVDEYGIDPATFAHITVKSRRHAAANPYAVFRAPLTVEEVLGSPHIYGPLTRFQCCPPTCGAAAAVLVSPEYARRHALRADVVIEAQSLVTDQPTTFEGDPRKLVGYDMTVAASRQVYEKSGIGPEDIGVVELHDCFTTNELLTYEALGLTPEGTAEKFVLDGANTYGGKVVTNPSGGLISKGHPLGATGLAQAAELVWQLRGQAEDRQVAGVDVALQHNLGLGGACVVTLYKKVDG
ncbi:lipid-transfer protein [Nonomuraea glycinis]|uniref:propanoyl-CoA C-acyltransferase n=1 Tax=Nonomuraea glycinis TaxID=2047744 RepID=A0A918ABG3_9ACTN|nr:lipid-transfer protein [Nonomuraea glycinis]MCA2181231.1 lipid-transfer protein [Nonomuraea glycinis]GGP13395.1 putative lipid-transfer protein Ltp1 [Nonomuraea glycinis]